jgi:hypothetical protein
MKIYGYSYLLVDITPSPIELIHKQAVIRFIKENFDAPQLIITDAGDTFTYNTSQVCTHQRG